MPRRTELIFAHTERWLDGKVAPSRTERRAALGVPHRRATGDDLWMLNGIVPPPADSDAEKLWAENNSAAPY
ncbi:tautomerase family protein [Saccharomonospora sp. NPDC046836]|uniref:tautomerase family protein n=1 Tax=Saccharomonospora sp. NPDC046836 TaxID=3156921 RepID=UPI0033D9E62C